MMSERTAGSSKAGFRSDINALRAIAVLGVLFFHYKVPLMAGGFSGVDIFFVISGFLMSRIIINGINRNTFSFLEFYTNRLKRIVPALLVLVAVIAVVTFFLYLPFDYMTNQKNAASSILFISNILYWSKSSYFDSASDTNLFLHTWSLSVEWQFYLIYPIILWIVSKWLKSKRAFFILLTLTTVVIFIISAVVTLAQPSASFYLLPTRSWEMLAGGVAFFTQDYLKANQWNKLIAIIGYCLLFGCLILLRPYMLWPGFYTTLPVLGTFLIIIANYNDFKLVRLEAVQFLGKISYSLYLWHWPVFVISQYFAIKLNLSIVVLLSGLSVALGYISFRYIESIKLTKSTPIIGLMCVLVAGTAALSSTDVNHALFKATTLQIANYPPMHTAERDAQMSCGKCFTETGIKGLNKNECLYIDSSKKNYLLIGDSHAAHLSQSLRERLAEGNIHLLQATANGGLPTCQFEETVAFGLKSKSRSLSREVMQYVYYKFIPQHASKIDGVILSGHWSQWENIPQGEILSYIQQTVTYLKKFHIKTIIVGQSEAYTLPFATIAAKNNEYNIETNDNYIDKRAYEMNQFLIEKLGSSYINIYNNSPFFKLSPKNTPYMSDGNHYTKYGADIAVAKILSNPKSKFFFSQTPNLTVYKQARLKL